MASATLFDFYEQQHQQQKQEAAEAEFLAHELLCFQDSSSSSSSSNSSCFIDLQPPPPASNSLFDLDDDCFDINALMEEDILCPLPDDAFISSPIPSSPPQLPKKPILHGATTIPPPPLPLPPPQPQFDNHFYGDYDLLFPEPEPFPYPSPEQQKYYYAVNRISTSSIDNQLLFVPPLYPEMTNNKRLKLMPSYHDEDYDLHHPLPPLPPAATNCCTFDDGIVPSSINTSCTYNGPDPQQFNSYALMNPAGILGQVPLYPNYTTGTKYLPTALLLPHDQQKFAVPLQVPPLPPPSQKDTAGAGTNIVSAQSIAARERRRRITEKTQEIAKLVPGGTKMNTAEMLQSAFKYVKFLQAQVGLLRLMRSPHCSDHQSRQGVGEQMDIQPNLLLLLHSLLMSQSVQEKLYMTEFCLIPADFLNTLLAADRSGGTDAYEFTSSSISDQVKELLLRHSSQSQPLIN